MRDKKKKYREKREAAALARAFDNVNGRTFDGCGVSDCITYNGKPSKHLDFAIDFKRQTLNEYKQYSRPVYVR